MHVDHRHHAVTTQIGLSLQWLCGVPSSDKHNRGSIVQFLLQQDMKRRHPGDTLVLTDNIFAALLRFCHRAKFICWMCNIQFLKGVKAGNVVVILLVLGSAQCVCFWCTRFMVALPGNFEIDSSVSLCYLICWLFFWGWFEVRCGEDMESMKAVR
jgi:hypothetical protein